jgi:hypothetical protein
MEICNEWKSTGDLYYTLTVEPGSAQSILFSSNKNPFSSWGPMI